MRGNVAGNDLPELPAVLEKTNGRSEHQAAGPRSTKETAEKDPEGNRGPKPVKTTVNEIWLPVNGYEGYYEVSNFGNVRSLDQIQQRSNGVAICVFHIRGRILKPYCTGRKEGYLTIDAKKNGTSKNLKVHRLVAEAFIPNPENKPVVNHIDGNKHNNRAENLEWCSVAENNNHAAKHGLTSHGEKNKFAKLTALQVAEIRGIYEKGVRGKGAKTLAKKYGVSNTTIRRIISRKKWKYEAS